jgi:hypothetical protein
MVTPDAVEKRDRYLKRKESLWNARSSYEPGWRDLGSFVQTRRTRFFTSEASQAGQNQEQAIINATATWALQTMSAGMFAGVTSPARPWVYVTAEDPDLADWEPAKEWFDNCAIRVLAMLARTNIYNVLHGTYQGLGGFGTHTFLLEEDVKTVLRAYPQPLGEYALAQDERGEVDTLYRVRRFAVRQAVRKFGLENVSTRVKDLYGRCEYDEPLEVLHVVEPREEYNPERQDGPNKPFASCWLELDCNEGEKVGLLRESGYDESPLLAPRWDALDEDTYGVGPGHLALGDTKALQLYERRKAQAVERIVDPSLLANSALRNLPINQRPGGITFADPMQRGPAIEPLINVPPAVVEVASLSIKDHQDRIRRAFGADLWLMMSESGEPEKTAREVAERHEEKLLQLGPVMERLETELLDKVVTRAISVLLRRGMLPKPPRELQGQQIKLQYMSVMAQAQRMVTGTAVQQFSGFLANVASYKPDVVDNVNDTEMVSQMSEALGLSPKMLVPSDQVQAARQQRAQAEAQAQQAELNQAQAEHAKTLADTDTGGDNALTQLLGGVAGAQAGGQA